MNPHAIVIRSAFRTAARCRAAGRMLLAVLALAPGPAVAATAPKPTAVALAAEARRCEDRDDYAGAAAALRRLRPAVRRDADLELWLAVFEARSGELDSARVHLAGPALRAAQSDTMPARRWTAYPWRKESTWTDGRWTGWHWYLWRARAEVAAALGRWSDALTAIRRATVTRPESGRDWYARAVCAAHLGLRAEADTALARAMHFDPALPEPHYLAGVLAWRGGHRAQAESQFRAAVAMDSAYRAPTLALLHVILPGVPPDSLPSELLSGVRRAGLLTAADGPKREVFRSLEVTPAAMVKEDPPELAAGRDPDAPPVKLTIAMLLDAEGHVALIDIPNLKPTGLDPARVAAVIATLPRWQYSPAVIDGVNTPSWTAWVFEFQP
jgi:tetratricopeptide (TPR) repeat protein